MEKRLEIQKNSGIDLGVRIYSKEWIRPYESIWGIIQNIKLVNTISDKDIASILEWNATIKEFYVQELAVYSQTHINVDIIKQRLRIPENHFYPLDNIMISNHQNDIIRNNVYICPICMKKYGYHSYYHQLSWIDRCPWHDCPLEETDIFYGLTNMANYCFGLKADELPSDVPLPCMSEKLTLNDIDVGLHDLKQIIIVKKNNSDLRLCSDWQKSSSRKLVFSAEDNIVDKYINILKAEENSKDETDRYLERILNNKENIYLERTMLSYTYNTNYTTHCYIHNIVKQFKGNKTMHELKKEEVISNCKKEAVDVYLAALFFAINITRTSNMYNALSQRYYRHYYSTDYSVHIRGVKWIELLYADVNLMTEIKSAFITSCFDMCISYEIQKMFFNTIWNQYISKLNTGITYAELSSDLDYPSYIIEEDNRGDWYVTEIT